MKMDGSLDRHPLFKDVPFKELEELRQSCKLCRFQRGDTIFEEGDEAEAIWLIQRGWIYLTKRTLLGTQATIYTVTSEDGLCGFSAVVGNGRYFASALAATDITAIRIPRERFVALIRRHRSVAEAVLAIYHTRMRHLAESIAMTSLPVPHRLAYTLMRLRRSFGKTIPVTHKELARMAGTRWETSIRTIAEFKRRGWLATARGKMTVLSPDCLEALSPTALTQSPKCRCGLFFQEKDDRRHRRCRSLAIKSVDQP